MIMVAHAKKSLTSIGRMAELLQTPPCRIRAALDSLEIGPSLELNAVPYYTADQVDRIAHRLRKRSAATTLRPADQPPPPREPAPLTPG